MFASKCNGGSTLCTSIRDKQMQCSRLPDADGNGIWQIGAVTEDTKKEEETARKAEKERKESIGWGEEREEELSVSQV